VLREIDGLTRAEATMLRYGASPKVAAEFRDVLADAVEHFIEKRLGGYPRDDWSRHMGSVVVAMRKLGKRRLLDDYQYSKNPWAQDQNP